MKYYASEAESYELYEDYSSVVPQPELRPDFSVVRGGGLDARARRGITRMFWSRLMTACTVLLVLSFMAVLRIYLTTATVSNLADYKKVSNEIETQQNLQSDLKIERAVLSSNSRISRIAVQNYGMVQAEQYDKLHLSALDAQVESETSNAAAQTEAQASIQAESSANTQVQAEAQDQAHAATANAAALAGTTTAQAQETAKLAGSANDDGAFAASVKAAKLLATRSLGA